MTNTAQQGLQSGVRRNTGTIRGRRDVRNTVFIPPPATENSVTSPMSDISSAMSPPIKPTTPILGMSIPEDRAMSDTTSVHSSHTLHSISGPVSHPELHEPGLHASIIETVNAWFEDSNASRSFVVGELALAYNHADDANAQDQVVRLNNFAILEKVAANPHFVTEVSKTDEEKRGEYNISLTSISRPIPTVAFKYQVHLAPPHLSSYSPVLFKPIWNLEEFQASVMIPYVVNPAFVTSTPMESIVLKNVVITVNLDLSPEDEVTKQPREVVRASGAVMYPNIGAAFRRKHSAVVWKFPELVVKVGSDEKLLARFATAASWPRKGKVEAKFEYHTSDASSRLGISVAENQDPQQQADKDPFADEGASSITSVGRTWKEVPTLRKLVAGKYVAS